jgi:uracil-DNA glycosylase
MQSILQENVLFLIKIYFMDIKIHSSWQQVVESEYEKPYFQKLISFVKNEYATKRCFPLESEIFAAFNHCPFDKVKVVIIGQDPYHGFGQANGLCFSVNDGINFPPSLINIFKEIQSDLGLPIPISGNLERWAEHGVLLLNATLTVIESEAGSHQKKGWEELTDKIISVVNENCEHVVFILWGAYAQKKAVFVDRKKHLVLESVHPSPLSAHRGFFGSKPFSKANSWLNKNGINEINW